MNKFWYIYKIKCFTAVKKKSSGQWLSFLEHCPVHLKVTGSIPGQGTYLGCKFDPQSGCIWEATNRYFSLTLMFLSLSLSLPSSFSKINKDISLGKDSKKKNELCLHNAP